MAREWDVLPPAPCKGCGGQHGAVNAEINCLRKRVDVLKSRVTRLNRIDESVAAFHRAPTTTGGAFAAQSLARPAAGTHLRNVETAVRLVKCFTI